MACYYLAWVVIVVVPDSVHVLIRDARKATVMTVV